jgi:hypothetical protein
MIVPRQNSRIHDAWTSLRNVECIGLYLIARFKLSLHHYEGDVFDAPSKPTCTVMASGAISVSTEIGEMRSEKKPGCTSAR